MNIFLDLEETVIDDWYSCIFLDEKIQKIKSHIQKISRKLLNKEAFDSDINLILFSAAVCDKRDLEIFNSSIKPILEEKLGLSFNSEFLFDEENWRNIAKDKQINVLPEDTIHDIFHNNIKEEIFNAIAIQNQINILFDDTVTNSLKEIFDTDIFTDKKTTLITVKM